MSTALKAWPKVRAGYRPQSKVQICFTCQQRLYRRQTVQENDIVLLKREGEGRTAPILTEPLKKRWIKGPKGGGAIHPKAIIGKQFFDVVATNKGNLYRIHDPTMAEYVGLSPRIVTPVYPQDANLIVSILDLHLPRYSDEVADGEEPFEIFEAGTGHGSLTLHLARAIHGANPPAPPIPPPEEPFRHLSLEDESTSTSASEDAPAPTHPENTPPPSPDADAEEITPQEDLTAMKEAYAAYLPTRRAIIQTLDNSTKHSAHAETTVLNFRHGLYYPNIDFHVSSIADYLSSRLQQRPSPFLAHAILDLPSPQSQFAIVARALRPLGLLLVFCPSVTQVIECMAKARWDGLPLRLETVLELGSAAGVGGREWDVRAVKPRSVARAEEEARRRASEDVGEGEGEGERQCEVETEDTSRDEAVLDGNDDARATAAEPPGQEWGMICRPKVGSRVTGGGFLGVFRRLEV